MKLLFRSMVTIQVGNPIGAFALRYTVLFARCMVLSLFIWVASFNRGRDFQGEKIIVGLARVLAYPVYLVEKPILNFYGPFRCLRVIPENFDFVARPISQVLPLEVGEPWRPDGILIHATPFFNRGFACNLSFLSLTYLCFFTGLRLLISRLRPNL